MTKSNILVVTGRGGTGKSTFSALMAKFFNQIKQIPLLLVDSDPDQSLASMMDMDLEAEGKETIAEVLSEILEKKKMSKIMGMSPTDKIEPFLFQKSLYEGESFFDFVGVGTKWIEGCYCLPDHALGQIIDRWASNYQYVIVDSPAGVEHLNRRITKDVKDVFNILDPSKKSFDNAKRSHKIMQEVGINFENYFLVGGYRFPESLEERAKQQPFTFLGRIEYDEDISNYNLIGKSLLKLPESSPTFTSITKILIKAGYKKRDRELSDLLKTTMEKRS